MTLLALAACAAPPAAPSPTSGPPPTYTALPTYTPAPTYTPLPTYTPYPTPITPTATPTATLSPTAEAVEAGGGEAGGSESTGGEAPTPTTYIGLQGIGAELPDMVPILTVGAEGASCGDWVLVQTGVRNMGTGPAQNFTVEWSLGWGSDLIHVEHIPEFNRYNLIYFYNGYIEIQCDQTTTFTAYVRVDQENVVAEHYEDNNEEVETYTLLGP
jgi:hypothetical protein